MSEEEAPRFPPLMVGEPVEGATDPMAHARALAALGCDGGTVVYNIQADRLRAAIVFAPEVALEDAMAMLPVCGVGFQNALGALAPPEVAVHLTWEGGIRLNGAACGALRVSADPVAPDAVPDWLVVGFDLPVLLTDAAPGAAPERTALYEEGCSEVSLTQLVESWARHTLVWINRWQEEGNAPLHAEWMGLLQGVGEAVSRDGLSGTFLGLDDRFGMLLRDAQTTHLVPMSRLLEDDA
jgi:biotin-(acetyl-CoA carboxylase) ligase